MQLRGLGGAVGRFQTAYTEIGRGACTQLPSRVKVVWVTPLLLLQS